MSNYNDATPDHEAVGELQLSETRPPSSTACCVTGDLNYPPWCPSVSSLALAEVRIPGVQDIDGRGSTMYRTALASSLRFYAAQRSGPLVDNPVSWRGDSGLDDTPAGGYYMGTSMAPQSLLASLWMTI